MGSALSNQTSREEAHTGSAAPADGSPEALRVQVAKRLAAHRERRERATGSSTARSASVAPELTPGDGQKARIAAAVAGRYAQAQSYRAFLAAEAERAVQQARAVAEIAARSAEAIAEAQLLLLESLAREQVQQPHLVASAELGQPTQPASSESMLWPELEPLVDEAPRETHTHGVARGAGRSRGKAMRQEPAATARDTDTRPAERMSAAPDGGMRILLYEELPAKQPLPLAFRPHPGPAQLPRPHRAAHSKDDHEAFALDEEISFRHAPVFEEPAGPPTPLPANLIEFPRQLVASRKARPRYAEGPLREEEEARAEGSQLRIFEVDAARISTMPEVSEPEEASAPQWTSLWLDTPHGTHLAGEVPHHADVDPRPDALPYAPPPARPLTARLSRRAQAAGIDLGLTAAATLLFALAVGGVVGYLAEPTAGWSSASIIAGAETATDGMPLASELGLVAAATGILGLAYQLLFFTFSSATPGMRLARIGLCTFSDDNPTRRAMRLRVLALVLSTVTLGLGHIWVLLDEDQLTWHDLISRMYPRSY